jgi:NAD(P)-dependent dehydrogenase (short-subunit alcohol dehydrogenase family)
MKLGEGLTAVVTGGGSGLGAATVKALAARGCNVTVLDLNEATGGRVAKDAGGSFFECDVTSEASVEAALQASRKTYGQERILINCAGIAAGKRTVRRVRDTGAIEPHDLATFARCVQVNLIGTFNMIAKSASGMMTEKPLNGDGERGVIVNTSSVAAEDGQVGQAAYAASKGGVLSMTLPIARDLAGEGIRVATILPGLFETPMFDGLPDEARQALAAQVPFPSRLGKPEEYAMLALQICENGMLNGCAVRIDGAIRLAPR